MDMGSISAAVGSLRVAGEIAMGLINLNTMAEVQAKAVELNQKIIAAQHEIFAANAAQMTMVERIRELEAQIANMKAWEAEKERYQLVSPSTGAMVYAVKKSMSNGEPPHYLCANCFKQGKASPVNDAPPPNSKDRWHTWYCPTCKSAPLTGLAGPSPAKYAEDINH